MNVNGKHYRTVWLEGHVVRMINQPLLPHRFEIIDLHTHEQTADAIRNMTVRGAGAIGATAGFGMAQAALHAPASNPMPFIESAADTLRHTRPTAQNLFYAIDRVLAAICAAAPGKHAQSAVAEANAIADEDAAACQAIGQIGAQIIPPGARVLTHCNAGWLAFVDWGSALSPIYAATREGKDVFVFCDETRPRGQGAQLTAWELAGEGVPHAIIADNAAGHFMLSRQIELVIVGADRIATNGDVANKIGTYEKAVVARENGIPFYVAAPLSTIDPNCPSGEGIPIEERSGEEVLTVTGQDAAGRLTTVRVAGPASQARNPAFDVTPARYITGIITPRGIIQPGRIASVL